MFRTTLKMILRSWAKNKIYFVISMFSLIIGLVSSIILIGFVVHEYSIAHIVEEGDRWYLLQHQNAFYKTGTEVMTNSSTVGSLALAIQRKFPEVEDICVCHDDRKWVKRENGEEVFYNLDIYAVTPNFVDLFRPALVAGNLEEALNDPLGMAVTRSFAIQNYGHENILGETLLLQSKTYVIRDGKSQNIDVEKAYRIKAIVDDRLKSYLRYDLLIQLPKADYDPANTSWMNSYYSFLKLNRTVDKKSLDEKLNGDEEFRESNRIGGKLHLKPLEEVYFSGDQQLGFIKSRDRVALYLAGSIALAILIIACFNYINISLTKSLQRIKNTGQQMIFGASRQEMRSQLILETALQVVIALIFAIWLINICLPAFNQFMNADLQLTGLLERRAWWLLLLLLIIVILGPSLYIFSRIGSHSLNEIMKSGALQRPKLVTGMVVAQFVVSVVLVIMVLGIRQQMTFIGHIRPGSEHILQLEAANKNSGYWEQFREQLQQIPEIEDYTSSNILSSGAFAAEGMSAMLMAGDERFVSFFGLKLIAGKGFDLSMSSEAVLVNETFVRKMNLEEPVNYRLNCNGEHLIVGVVEDFIIDHLSRKIQPLMIQYHPYPDQILVKIKEGNSRETISKLENLWETISGEGSKLGYCTMATMYENLHKEEQRVLQMAQVFSWVSLFLTALGLFGLAWYSVESRKKEIGLRKINGATQQQVIGMLCLWFMRWIGLSLLIGLPLAFFLLRSWRMQYVYRPPLTVWIFAGGIGIILTVGLLTVCWQSWKAARVNPAKIIKNE